MEVAQFPLKATFLALPLEGEAKWEFQRLQSLLSTFDDFLSFQNPQSPHLTLQYWPNVMEIEYHQIIDQARRVASKHTPFTLKIEGADTFGSKGEDKVLFLSVPFSEELAKLKKSCPWPSGKPFHAHITLARIKHPQRFVVHKKEIMKLLKDASLEASIEMLRLYAEINGKKQTPITEFLLGA